jgi:hypothetical protein
MSERELCQRCDGNGTVKIYHGVSVCPHCKGECWEPVAELQSRADALSDKLRLVRDALSLDLGDGVDVVDGARACREDRDRLRAALADVTAMCGSAAVWPDDDVQGLRYHALEAARRGKAELAR